MVGGAWEQLLESVGGGGSEQLLQTVGGRDGQGSSCWGKRDTEEVVGVGGGAWVSSLSFTQCNICHTLSAGLPEGSRNTARICPGTEG